jgi:signal transduction histidine kinase/ActR/RegA family two-component response regulator
MDTLTSELDRDEAVKQRADAIFQAQLDINRCHIDRRFAWLMIIQWLAGIVAAVWLSPRTWEGQYSQTNIHVWAAFFLGGIISGFPVYLAINYPGATSTRHVIAVGQMLSCGLLIHLTGGRIESHFQYFGALAFLAFYRDWRVLLTATIVAGADHFIRGIFWPLSIFGVLTASPWRSCEHVGWILFEDIFLVLSIRQNLLEMLAVAEHQAKLEKVNELVERKIKERTSELRKEILERERSEDVRKKIEARMLQSQKMEIVGKLAGGVAHEFNSILTAIIGQSEYLGSSLSPLDPRAKSAREIRQAAERAATLTRQLLAYGRKQILQPEIIDLNQVLAGMLNTLKHLMGREVDVRIVAAPELRTVKIDPSQIEQVIVNMAMNAADAMPNGGRLTLETTNVVLDEEFVRSIHKLKAGDYVMLAITDTGMGMTEEVKARLFEPFFTTKEVGQGTGLGLATCYGIVKQSGGHISAYSEVARGATFKIYLPQVGRSAQVHHSRSKPPDLPGGTETILLAEDDPALLEMCASLLRRLGYTVLTAANGLEAMRLKQQRDIGHIDLLLTDVVMPHMSGKELSERIQMIYPNTKILFTSAYTENAIVHQGVLHDGVVLLQKPFTPSALAHKVREVLNSPTSSSRSPNENRR